MDNTTQQLTAEEARDYMVTLYGRNTFDRWLPRFKCPQKALEVALLATTGNEKEYQAFVKASEWAGVAL